MSDTTEAQSATLQMYHRIMQRKARQSTKNAGFVWIIVVHWSTVVPMPLYGPHSPNLEHAQGRAREAAAGGQFTKIWLVTSEGIEEFQTEGSK